MAFTVVLDACVLAPHPLFDTVLRLADAGLYEVRWSQQILDEVERTLVNKFGMEPQKARARIVQMDRAFPLAKVEGHEALIDAMTNHPKDRHVLAAAVRAGVGTIVTSNLKDFDAHALAPYDVEALHPDEFLLDQLDLEHETVMRCLAKQSDSYANPPTTLEALCDGLSHTVPQFAAAIPVPPPLPLPLEQVDPSLVVELVDNYSRTTPFSAVAWWFKLLQDPTRHYQDLREAVLQPEEWGDFHVAAVELVRYNLTSHVEHAPNPDVARVTFAPLHVATTSRVVGPIPVPDLKHVVARRCEDGLWRVDSVVRS